MHPHEKLIRDFYAAFARGDADAMARCYHPDIVFTDPVFPLLKGTDAAAMWRMLVSRARDFSLELTEAHADAEGGTAHWEAHYLFSKTGRKVHNRVDAMFAFRDGLIVRHIDRFNFWRWAAQALGPAGAALGWFPPLKWKVRSQAKSGLDQFVESSRRP
jgi:ketosteroid isomerase-like protein